MRSVVIVFLPPGFRNSLSFPPVVENLTVQALIPQLINKTFNVAILPGTAGSDEQGRAARFFKPLANSFGHNTRDCLARCLSLFAVPLAIIGRPMIAMVAVEG